MKHELSGFAYWKAVFARWLVRVATWISPLTVLSICLDISSQYDTIMPNIDMDDE
jgi:hypothetical protein